MSEVQKEAGVEMQRQDSVHLTGAGPSGASTAPLPPGFVIAPDWKGYARLGTGMYCIEHSAAPPDPELGAELIIRLATEKDRSGNRQIGEQRDTDGGSIQPEDMAIRIGFLSPAALDALESQLRVLRAENFPDSMDADDEDAVASLMLLATDYADDANAHGLFAPSTYESRSRLERHLRERLSAPHRRSADTERHGQDEQTPVPAPESAPDPDLLLLLQAAQALELGRDYVNAELIHRRDEAYVGYPHKYAAEQEDLAHLDRVLSALRQRIGKAHPLADSRSNEP